MSSCTNARSLTSAIYAILRQEIISCRLAPGEKLNIKKLATASDVSLAAVREALSRLAANGLVTAEDQRGFRVSPASISDLKDVTETRIEIECLALRRAISRGGADWIEGINSAWVGMSDAKPGMEQWPRLHNEFHAALVEACGLQWLMRFRAVLFEQSERYRSLSRQPRPDARNLETEHQNLMEATLDRDADKATQLLTEHFNRTRDLVLEHYHGPGHEHSPTPSGIDSPDDWVNQLSKRMQRYYEETKK